MRVSAEYGASPSLEDALAGAMWVGNLTDPSLSMAQLHETFLEVIFAPAPVPAGAVADSPHPRQRLRTAAEVERERRERARLLREVAELTGNGPRRTTDEDDASLEEEEDEEAEEEAEDEYLAEEQDFLAWIDAAGHVAQQGPSDTEAADEAAVELELGRVGLGKAQETAAADILPERLKAIEVRERRPRLGAKALRGGYTYTIPLEREAYWVLRQLRNAGQPLAHNTRICTLANRTQAEVVDEPVVVALTYALQKMTREFLEPSHLMMYHQTHLHPLLFALLEGSPMMAAAEHSLPMPALAYSARTGRRQRPFLSETFVGFAANSTASIGEGDAAWRHLSGADYTVRKPCFVDLGRLLVRILELDALCHRLEYRRQQMLILLRDSTEAWVQEQRSLLENIVFESAVEADLWHSFVQFLTSTRSRGAYHVIRALGIEDAFEEYTITALQYQENLASNTPIVVCSQQPRMHLRAWAEQVGSVLSPPRSAEAVLALFNSAIVDSFAKLPLLCKQVVSTFCAEGDVIVTYTSVAKPDDMYPLSSFFTDHYQHYVDLVQQERQGAVKLFYVVDEQLIRRILNVNQLYQQPLEASIAGAAIDAEWCREREIAMELLVYRLTDALVPKVKSELWAHAKYQLDAASVARLGLLCAQGPYEPTKLVLDAYSDSALTWEPEWNVTEALPRTAPATSVGIVEDTTAGPLVALRGTPQSRSRVCAVYQGDNGITSFAFIDESGAVVGSTRWSECAMNSALGRAAALVQHINLEKLFVQCQPTVVAVAATGPASLALMRSMQDFVRTRVHPVLGVALDIVWATPEVARFCSESSYIDVESPTTDAAMRTSIAVARYVQEPLSVLAMLFDARLTVARLFLAGATGPMGSREAVHELFQRLSWEMSLWVGATGVWLEDCVRRPSSVAVLQFVPGLGPSKARLLSHEVCKSPVASRATLYRCLSSLFGDVVAGNAIAAVRVGVPDAGDEDAARWRALDQTLIPPAWYGVAEELAVLLMRSLGTDAEAAGTASTSTLHMLAVEDAVKRGAVARLTATGEYLTEVQQVRRPAGVELVPGTREYLLMLDELVAAGQSFLRRPYRRLSSRELMVNVTGVTFVSQGELLDVVQRGLAPAAVLTTPALGGGGAGAADATAASLGSFMVKEGDYITGTVTGVRGGASAGIRLVTARGLDAFVPLEDIPDEPMRAELEAHVRFLETAREARAAGTPLSDTVMRSYKAPDWVRRGALVQGTAARCNWGRCELHLRWCPPREVGVEGGGKAAAASPSLPPSYASLAGYVPNMSDTEAGQGGVSSPRDGRVFTTKISRHVLFRSFTSVRAHEELRDREIGEVLLRPSSQSRNKAVCVVKLGVNSTGDWVIEEERRPNGSIYYVLKEKLIGQTFTFDDVDELLRNYIAPLVHLVRGLRQHRRFVENVQDVPAALEAQLKATGERGFAYCFAETGVMSRPPLYRVFTTGGGRAHQFRLHFASKSIYVRLPLARPSAGAGSALHKWVECRSAEHVSETVKNHARRSSEHFS